MRLLILPAFLAIAVTACDDGCGPRTPLAKGREVLLHPDSAAFRATPPDTFYVRVETSRGDVVIQVVREWSPLGAYRFYNLVRNGFFDGNRFFRVVPDFAAQFGATGVPAVDKAWNDQKIPADPPGVRNTRGMVAFAQSDPDSRTTQMFFNLNDNPGLDQQHFTPIGRVVSGWNAVRRLNDEYGELGPEGSGPPWRCIYKAGNRFMDKYYPRLDSITRARLMEGAPPPAQTAGGS